MDCKDAALWIPASAGTTVVGAQACGANVTMDCKDAALWIPAFAGMASCV